MNPSDSSSSRSEDSFFEERRGPAILKHGILRGYLQPFASKTGSASRGKRVVYLDGYAGPGVYSNGDPGSPALAAETAERLSRIRTLECIYVERNKHYRERLTALLSKTNHKWTILPGSIAKELPKALMLAGDAPLFAFFDPFGLGLPFHLLTGSVLSRSDRRPGGARTGPATEVLLNFTLAGLCRNAGHLTGQMTKARPQLLNRYLFSAPGQQQPGLIPTCS
jgi:three-Cys-motif partner protein